MLLQVGPALAASPRDGGATAATATASPRALGFVPDPRAPSAAALKVATPLALPSAVDLGEYDPPVGNQGGVGSCTAWATGYYLRGWYAKRDGYYPGGSSDGAGSFEPMYTYAQLVQGQNIGSTFSQNLSIQQSQGTDTRADYTQGDYDYTDWPNVNEATTAAFFKIASYTDVSNGGGTSLQTWIESTLAGGNPVAIGIPVYPEFDQVSSTNYVVYPPKPGETSRGGHAVFAYKYDATGLWIKNSWGAGWGTSGDGDPNKGSAELSWSFVNGYGVDAASIVPLAPFTQIPGQLASIAAGGYANEVWGLNAVGQIYRFNPTTGGFTQVPGVLASIAVGAGAAVAGDDAEWGLNAAGQIYRFSPNVGAFTQVDGRLASIAVDSTGSPWGLNAAGQIYDH